MFFQDECAGFEMVNGKNQNNSKEASKIRFQDTIYHFVCVPEKNEVKYGSKQKANTSEKQQRK